MFSLIYLFLCFVVLFCILGYSIFSCREDITSKKITTLISFIVLICCILSVVLLMIAFFYMAIYFIRTGTTYGFIVGIICVLIDCSVALVTINKITETLRR